MKNNLAKISIFTITCLFCSLFSNYIKASDDDSTYLLNTYLKRETLNDLSKSQLSLLRNEIYATHGYAFKSKKIRQYFQKKQWYEAKKEFSSEKITIAEKALIRFIKEYEQKELSYRKTIIGKWVPNFPFGSGHAETYEFKKTGDFIFIDFVNASKIKGKWRTEDYNLFIRIPNKEWILVCDIRSYNEYWYPKRKELGYPPKISIKQIKNNEVKNYVSSYFKIPLNY